MTVTLIMNSPAKVVTFLVLLPVASAASLEPRIDNGLGKTPAMGWSGWVCGPGVASVRHSYL